MLFKKIHISKSNWTFEKTKYTDVFYYNEPDKIGVCCYITISNDYEYLGYIENELLIRGINYKEVESDLLKKYRAL